MTDRELMELCLRALQDAETQIDQTVVFHRTEIDTAIIALRARLAEPEGEPVAYIARHWEEFNGGEWEWDAYTPEMYAERKDNPKYHDWTPCYRIPPTAAAIRAQAIEDCARVCEERSQFAPRNERDIGAVQHGASIAAAIRNLDKTRDIKEQQ